MYIDVIQFSWHAGFLQLLFLAGATNHPIQQHCSRRIGELYKLMVPPCSCAESYKPVADVMWVNFGGDKQGLPNHLVPLISCSGEMNYALRGVVDLRARVPSPKEM